MSSYPNTSAFAMLHGLYNSRDVRRCSWILDQDDDDEDAAPIRSPCSKEAVESSRIMKLLLLPKPSRNIERRFTNDSNQKNICADISNASTPTPTPTLGFFKSPTHIPSEVLRQVTITGYLNYQELGRFLLCTSPSFVPNLGSDYVWKYLCQSKWKYTLHMDQSLIQAVGGYESLFRKLSRPALLQREQDPKREFFSATRPTNNNNHHHNLLQLQSWPALPQPTLKLEQLQLFLSIRDGNNNNHQELVSILVPRDNLVQFVEQGQVGVQLDNINKNTSPIRIDVPLGESLESRVGNWTATLHLVRLDTHQICAINKADAVSVDGHEVTFLSQWLPLTYKGRHELERRIQAHDVTCGETYLGISCHVQLAFRRTSQQQLQLDQLQLQVRRRHGRFPSALLDARQEEQRRHGVTLLHLWNELQGWDDF